MIRLILAMLMVLSCPIFCTPQAYDQAIDEMIHMIDQHDTDENVRISPTYLIDISRKLTNVADISQPCSLQMPPLKALIDRMNKVDIDSAISAHNTLRYVLANSFVWEWMECFSLLPGEDPYLPTDERSKRCNLRNIALTYLAVLGGPEFQGIVARQYWNAHTMDDRLFALQQLVQNGLDSAESTLANYRATFCNNSEHFIDWISIQARYSVPARMNSIWEIEMDRGYEIENERHVRALALSFADNIELFHQQSGEGYLFLGTQLRAWGALYPNTAQEVASAFSIYSRLDPQRKNTMREIITLITTDNALTQSLHHQLLGYLEEGQ